MQLSRLEAKGFKSFGEKITINFEDGITGIVGPNGCGKSNVVDAIRWVLGEQKTSNLRSEKMEDVIFNGTKTRKPHQMAEVNITFNNTKNLLPTEYSQVTVTRRYYRSGDSEYELNGVQCRLKDINNLFMDTGIGPDSYAIIELKMVEDILKDRDGSRRQLFEEAAGVSKFKIRKKQTLRKLEDTDKDLARVDDLLFEIDRNLKSLEKQAKQAEKYYELKEEYKKLSIKLAQTNLKEFETEKENLHKRGEQEADKRTALVAEIATLEAELEKLKLNILNEEKNLKSAQTHLNDHISKIRNYESENKIKNERLKYLTENQEKLTKQLQADKELKEKSEIFLNSVAQESRSLEKQYNEQSIKVDRLKADNEQNKKNLASLQAKINELNLKIKTLNEQSFTLSKSVEIGKFQINTLKQELEKTTTDTQSQSHELDDFEEKLQNIILDKDAKEKQLQKLENQELENGQAIEQTEKNIAQIKDQIGENGRKLDAKQNEYNLLKSLVDNLEGFPEAVRFLKKNASWVKNVPLLSDILTCDETFRICIENYLEPLMNYYIVDNEQDAINAVKLLSDASKGKANFFILDKFDKKYTTKSDLFNLQNEIDAFSVIEFDKKYENLIAHLLGHVKIIKDNNEQVTINEHQDYITLNGKIIKRKNSVSGGSVGLFEGKRIGRAKNLEILEKDIKALTQKLALLKEELEKNTKKHDELKLQSKRADLERVKTEYGQIQQEYVAYKTRREQIGILLNKNSDKREEILQKIGDLQAEIAQNEPMATKIANDLQNLRENFELESEVLEKQTQITNETAQLFNEQNMLLYQLESKLKASEQDMEYKKSNIELATKRIEQNVAELSKIEVDVKALLEKAEVNDDHLIALYEEKEKLEKLLNETEKGYYFVRGEQDKIDKTLRETQKQRENSDFILIEINNKFNESNLKLNSVKERLMLEFNLEIEDLDKQNIDNVVINSEELKNKISQIKNSMDRLGQINPMAMEAYNEMKERHDMISQQKADIENARNSLLATISEIDITAKENFLTSFEMIKENFKKVFRSLFTEDDSCDLILVDPNDPLDSDIDILARPKGKRPQSINQLSGGEKTLTAISLLFGIYLIKPAPFCIFDEVDAPLDDNNIDKFNNIIKKFSDSSQFIIVTHNKRTMSSTDVIYGVTMIETGVSRVVPVDLRNLD